MLRVFLLQKLSQLVTEAYKDAHAKSVVVRQSQTIYYHGTKVFDSLHLFLLKFVNFIGYERKNERSCAELRYATRSQRRTEVRSCFCCLIPFSGRLFFFNCISVRQRSLELCTLLLWNQIKEIFKLCLSANLFVL